MKIKIVDLFAGMGGFRLGVEKSFKKNNISVECMLTSEIKPHAIKALSENFSNETLKGDIYEINENEIPDFDILLAGFPCQPFSSGGKRLGFLDTRGTLFFEIERVLKNKKPNYFILENVDGLVKHDLENKNDKIGRTLKTILIKLEELGYKVSWRVIDSINCGTPQSRKRIFIVGSLFDKINLDEVGQKREKVKLKEVLESGRELLDTKFTKLLLENFSVEELKGKSIKDKRGGPNNIHSWDFSYKGETTPEQRILLNKIFKYRRHKRWSEEIGIKWMDGIPLTINQIKTFHDAKNLKKMLEDLREKGYLKLEHPKELFKASDGKLSREYDKSKEMGYNIVTGKLSFEISKILDPDEFTPTLVATDIDRLGVIDGLGIRRLTIRECLRLCGYPEEYTLNNIKIKDAYDLIGNTVVVSVVEEISDLIKKEFLKNI